MVDLDVLYKNIMEFLVKLRCENAFDEKLYAEIYRHLEILFKQWETQDTIPKSAFISCAYLLDDLAGGNRFWSDEVCVKVEDAHIAIQELITNIDEPPPLDFI
ncbi:MAG: hypothetical protein FWB96_04885 [Defluviitaleaceae bacterium]|nr:hypothetical protein [Defluviitaleaceae bacterium]MCL2262718.1 hypothetical protein [Defluviitaleaceae bacterium]